MLAQQANLHRETPQAWINTPDFYETKAKTLPSQEPLARDMYSWLSHVWQKPKDTGSTTASNSDKAWLTSNSLSFQSIQEADIQ